MQGPTTAVIQITLLIKQFEPICFKMASSTTVKKLKQTINEECWLKIGQYTMVSIFKGKKNYFPKQDAQISSFAEDKRLKIQMQIIGDRDFDFSGLKAEEIRARKVKKLVDARSLNKVRPGSNLHFTCSNQKGKCEAFGKSVKVQKGFGLISIGKQLVENCPLCSEVMMATTNIGFYQCKVKIEGRKSDNTPYIFEKEFADDLYHQFNDISNENLTRWRQIKVSTVQL